MVEGRDYRSPNALPPGPEKSIWGEKQKAWLQQTLLESDAVFKILVSPTPMVGPDDLRKQDNHTNPLGFRAEGEAFFQWLKENNFLQKIFTSSAATGTGSTIPSIPAGLRNSVQAPLSIRMPGWAYYPATKTLPTRKAPSSSLIRTRSLPGDF